VTRERLVGWDVDQNYDLYDARVGGGLPDPIPPQPPCAGESCQGSLGTPPNDLNSASSNFHGSGNPRARKHHKKKHHKKRHHKRHTNSNRRPTR
jgi:hypothetical protein